jgi:glycerol-3-phosphate O-acyltransferase
MTHTVELPLWLFVLIMLFAAVTALSHFLLPSVRWFFRRRLEKAVARLNTRLTRPIEPFKLARRYDMIQRLIYDPQVTQAIVDQAKEENTPENVAFEKARRYAREIVPSFSAFTYFSFGIRAARLLATSLYDVRTGSDNDARLKSISSDATVVFVMNHRSNMDYVLVTYLAANASALSYAVGEWARVWPLSRLIKSMGAYFISRKQRGALYRKVLARYVQMATQAGVTQAIFPEGGLTVDGKLKPLKMGLLSYVVDNFDLKKRDIIFVPVAINYDRVLEDRVLIAANQRGDRRFGAKMSVIMTFILSKIWEKARGKYKRFGGAVVNFGDPLSLRAFEKVTDIEALAAELKARIEDVMPVMIVPLLSQVFLVVDQALDDEALHTAARDALSQYRGPATDMTLGTLPVRVAAARAQMVERGMIADTPAGWVVVEEQRALLQFYANSLDGLTREDAATA